VSQHDSAALKARQCRAACGLRAKNEPLTTNATLQRIARTTKYEDAMCANAAQDTTNTKRTKDCDAGQPEATCLAQPMRSQKAANTTQRQKDAVLPPNA